jgi:hypothetical protein
MFKVQWEAVTVVEMVGRFPSDVPLKSQEDSKQETYSGNLQLGWLSVQGLNFDIYVSMNSCIYIVLILLSHVQVFSVLFQRNEALPNSPFFTLAFTQLTYCDHQ